jgi:putative glutamine amidotransferase
VSGRIAVCVESAAKAPPYVDALKAAGAQAESLQVISPEQRPAELARTGAECAGLLLCGGPDMEPWRYRQKPRPDARLSLSPELDQIEWDLLTGAEAARRPVWAVCRGLQTVNVFLGGTLWQDIPSQLASAVEHDVPAPLDARAHPVDGARHADPWAALLTVEPLEVNSRHHQALRDLGRGLSPVVRSPDGLVEAAVVAGRDWWVKGVQWHPEDLVHQPLQLELWREFVRTALPGGGRRRDGR